MVWPGSQQEDKQTSPLESKTDRITKENANVQRECHHECPASSTDPRPNWSCSDTESHQNGGLDVVDTTTRAETDRLQ